MYALYRLQAESGTWYWAVHLKRRGQLYSRRFYEPKHGGSAKAKRAAIAWRDAQIAQLPALTMLEFCGMVRANNTSGIPGVHFLTNARQPLGLWQAKLKLAGKAIHKSFSVKRHGYDQALRLAVDARRRMLAESEDAVYLYDKVAKAAIPAPHKGNRSQRSASS